MAEPPETKSGARLPLLYCEKTRLFTNILPAFFLSGCPVNRIALEVSIDSNDASRISAPLRTKLAQSNKVEPRAKIANVNVGTENDDVIL